MSFCDCISQLKKEKFGTEILLTIAVGCLQMEVEHRFVIVD